LENLFRYDGKRVLITGASSGMGEATARLVHSLGAEIVALDVQPPKYDFADYMEVDLRDRAAIEQAVEEATAARLHNLFYCAGLPGGKFPAVDVVTVNFISQRHMIHCLLPHLQRGDAVVSVSSGAGMGYSYFGEKLNPFLEITDFAQARDWVRAHEEENWLDATGCGPTRKRNGWNPIPSPRCAVSCSPCAPAARLPPGPACASIAPPRGPPILQ
jgi:NAD(P)-dependent dehydrogenase (short-subunit alcohol dehydrogenase family)